MEKIRSTGPLYERKSRASQNIQNTSLLWPSVCESAVRPKSVQVAGLSLSSFVDPSQFSFNPFSIVSELIL